MTEAQAMPLQIAYLLQQFPVATETFAASDIAALITLGHCVTVYTIKARPSDEGKLRELCGVPEQLVIDRPSLSAALSWPALIWRERKAAVGLGRNILKFAPMAPKAAVEAILCLPRVLEIAQRARSDDVVHAFWSRHVGLVLPILEADSAAGLRSAFVGAYDLIADDFLVRLTLDSAQAVFSHAETNRDYLDRRAAGGALVRIVNRGIPLPTCTADDTRDKFRFVTASALTRPKNVQAVIKAFAEILKRERRASLRIFGDGKERCNLEALASDLNCAASVTFAGHVSRRELHAELEQASVFVLLSTKLSERLPNVIKEALWAGCSIVSSNSEGIEELIPDSGIGQVVDAENQQAVANAMFAALAETDEAAALRRARSRKFIKERFSSERSMQRYVDAWREAICGR